jgi:hypothetical protein
MRVRLGVTLLFAVLVATVGINAQLGGIMRRAGEAVRGATDPTQKPQSEQNDTSRSRLGCDTSDSAMDRLLKGMEAERAFREAALKQALSAGTQAQYQACTAQVASSPEYLDILMSLGNLPENVSTEEMMKASQKMAADMQALAVKKCGADPSAAVQQLNQQFNEPIGQKESGLGDCHDRLIEHMEAFCRLPDAQQTSATSNGLAAPGSGAGVFWIFTAAEANAYKPRCARFLQLTAELDKQVEQQDALRRR